VDVKAYMDECRARVDTRLEALLPPAARPPESLHGAMRHLVFPGGKRLRPAVAFAAAEAVGGAPAGALPAAVAVELLHTYSLIHDDLPCMDDDVERRGRPTVHVAWGEAVAVLAGDALQALAFEQAARAGEHGAAVAAELASAAGSLVAGQVDDLAFDGAADLARIESVHERKTAALFVFAAGAGARLGGGPPDAVDALRAFGREAGVAFQLADDALDVDDDDPCSAVRVLGAEGARQRAEEWLDAALGRLEPFGERAEPLRELARFAARRDR